MNKEQLLKFYLVSYFIVSAFQGFTGSVIHIFMIKHISEEFFKIYRSLDMLMPIIVLLFFKKNISIIKVRRKFTFIIGFSTIAFTVANIGGMFNPEFRFIMISVLEGIGSFIWIIIMNDLFNNTFSRTDLTVWNNKNDLYAHMGSFVGATIVIACNVDINACLILQCVAYIYLGFVDWYTFNTLDKTYKVFENKKEGEEDENN